MSTRPCTTVVAMPGGQQRRRIGVRAPRLELLFPAEELNHRAAAHIELDGLREVRDRRERDNPAQRGRRGQPPRRPDGQHMPRGGPQRELSARGMPRHHDAPDIHLRQRPPGKPGQRVHRGGDIVERLRPPPGHRPAPPLLRNLAPPPVLDIGDCEPAPGQKVGEGSDMLPVVRCPPRPTVQHDDERGTGLLPARGIEVDDLVGMLPVREGGVRRDGRMRKDRLGLGGVTGDGVRHCCSNLPTEWRN
ncbi:hypothetical protein QFZ67_003578 [Streptomyces sp. V1I1]|nr:hypothetical protein [Streptomyces sp. V1I1]